MVNLGAGFYPKLVQMSTELGMKPEDLLVVMVSESGLNPSALEPKYRGSGLVGFMPDTLKGLGFKGGPDQFTKLSGEEQLDFVRPLIQNATKLNNGPITSATKYYVANFFPAALKLPGVRSEDPSAVILEKSPQTIPDPKTGKLLSKKYYDTGTNVTANYEKLAYEANPLFHGTGNKITYGDMQRIVDKKRTSSTYQQAVAIMKQHTGYTPSKSKSNRSGLLQKLLEKYKGRESDFIQKLFHKKPTSPISSAPEPASTSNVSGILDTFLQKAVAAEVRSYKALPDNRILIQIKAADYVDAVEFARILCAALDEELFASAYTHTNGNKVEVECSIRGAQPECFAAVRQLSSTLSDLFQEATIKIGGIKVSTHCLIDKRSSYQAMDLKSAQSQYRKFSIKFAKESNQ